MAETLHRLRVETFAHTMRPMQTALLAALALAACSSPAGLSPAELLCSGAVACRGPDAGVTIDECVAAFQETDAHEQVFVTCCEGCPKLATEGDRLACEAHCGGVEECCPR